MISQANYTFTGDVSAWLDERNGESSAGHFLPRRIGQWKGNGMPYGLQLIRYVAGVMVYGKVHAKSVISGS